MDFPHVLPSLPGGVSFTHSAKCTQWVNSDAWEVGEQNRACGKQTESSHTLPDSPGRVQRAARKHHRTAQAVSNALQGNTTTEHSWVQVSGV